jgi:hypothetical protein
MRAERDFRNNMETQRKDKAEYLGALVEGERRLVLVPMDPAEPWEAFRRMRSWMREKNAKAKLDVFAAPKTLENKDAKVIPLRKRAQ